MKSLQLLAAIAPLVLVLLAAPARTAEEPASRPASQPVATAPVDAAEVIRTQRPAYPFKTCAVSGEALDSMGGPLDHVVDGRLIRLCCKGCVEQAEQDKAKILARIDAAVVREQKPGYPLTTCVVSGEELGKGAVDFVHGTKLVRTCCERCVASFRKQPAAYVAELDAAWIAAQRASYPLTECIISGEPLPEEPVDHLYGTRLLRMCCTSCERVFLKNPEVFVKEYEAAFAKAAAAQK